MTLYVADPNSYDPEEHEQWSIHGPGGLYKQPTPASPAEKLKALLPAQPEPYPFEIDNCGYVVMNCPVPLGTFGKAMDAEGRNVFIVGQHFLFSRYGGTDRYVYTATWETGMERRPSSYQPVPDFMWEELLAAAKLSQAVRPASNPYVA